MTLMMGQRINLLFLYGLLVVFSVKPTLCENYFCGWLKIYCFSLKKNTMVYFFYVGILYALVTGGHDQEFWN